MTYIFTADEKAKQIALNELHHFDCHTKLIKWISSEKALVEFDKPEVFEPIFIRHIMKVGAVCSAKELKEHMLLASKEKTISVQTVVCAPSIYKKNEINALLNQDYEEKGFQVDVASPEQVLSVLIDGEEAYIGLSDVKENISAWAGGNCRFAKDDTVISRAEFKLLEAIESFDLRLPKHGLAADLGAAPGGWTKVLRQYGLEVHAVDPANLHESLRNDASIKHFKKFAQQFFKKGDKFDIITNDMKLDVKESTGIMVQAKDNLKKDALGILTLKLPQSSWQRITKQCLMYLDQHYEIVAARQLFHNRSEVTVVLKNSK